MLTRGIGLISSKASLRIIGSSLINGGVFINSKNSSSNVKSLTSNQSRNIFTINNSRSITQYNQLKTNTTTIREYRKVYHTNNNNSKEEKEDNVLQCFAYCISKSIKRNLSDLPENFSLDKVFPVSNVMWLRYNKNTTNKIGDIYIFPSFGCVVFWGVPEPARKQLFDWLNNYTVDRFSPAIDRFSYVEGSGSNTRFDIDSRYKELITLSSSPLERINEMFATSYALAQSVRLNLIEDDVINLSQKVENLPDELSRNGTVQIKKSEIVKQLGEQMKIKNFLNLHSDIIDTPEHFWEHTEGEGIYKIVRGHCEIDKRVRIMNERLNLISGIYDVINDEMKHSHSIRLERIIIALIALEALIGVVNWISK